MQAVQWIILAAMVASVVGTVHAALSAGWGSLAVLAVIVAAWLAFHAVFGRR